MRLLVPHVQQAVRCQMLIGFQLRELQSTLTVLDRLRHGVVLLAANGRTVFVNAAAKRIFDSRDGLLLRGDGSVYAQHAAEDTTLRRVIGLCGVGDGDGIRSPGCLTISRPTGQRALVVHAMPVGDGRANLADARASTMLFILDPEREARPPLDLVRHLYGLTKAEAAVALGVGRGEGLQRVADDLSISISTARIHLQRAFEKTGTHRQAELVRLLIELEAG
jgi:DNA-binding CsgD family transcriptional regulator